MLCFFVIKLKKVEDAEEEEGKEEESESPRRRKKSQEEIEEEEEKAEAAEAKARKLDQWIATFAMNMAWSFFYSTKWALGSIPGWSGNTEILCLTEAVVVSVVCFAMIFVLDWFADQEWTPDEVDECIIKTIGAIGILIGFSWEQSFDASVAAPGSVVCFAMIFVLDWFADQEW